MKFILFILIANQRHIKQLLILKPLNKICTSFPIEGNIFSSSFKPILLYMEGKKSGIGLCKILNVISTVYKSFVPV